MITDGIDEKIREMGARIRELRELDVAIQGVNWTTELL